MNRTTFLSALRDGLSGVSKQEIDEILADYAAHFSEGAAAGRSEDDVAAALGDPKRLARELRAEAGLRRWEASRSAGNFVAVVFAFVGLMTVDLIFLVPVLSIIALVLFIFGVALIACLIAGMAMVVSLLLGGAFSTLTGAAARGLAGVGLVAGAIGGGALLLLVLDALVRLLGRYARVHYRLLSPAKTAT